MDKCYKADMLKKVIVRTDFTSLMDIFKEDIPKKLKDIIFTIYPIFEKREEINKQIEITEDGVKEKINKVNTFYFSSIDRTKRLVINSMMFFIEYEKYESYIKLKEEYSIICNGIQTIAPECKGNRFGLRYINNLEMLENNIFDWTEYLDDKIISTMSLAVLDGKIIRDFHNTTFRFPDDSMMAFQYGMFNQDFPAYIKNKMFILDYDISINGIFDNAKTLSFLDEFHNRIQASFESHIKQKLRDMMGEVHE